MRLADPTVFGGRLSTLLEDTAVTHKELADAVGVARPTVTGWSQGYRMPRLKRVAAVADFFGVSVEFFLGDSEAANDCREQALLLKFRRAPESVRRDVEMFLDFRLGIEEREK